MHILDENIVIRANIADMNFVIEQLSLLGLNGREVRVFTTLSTFGRMNMTLLASRAGLARTTVDAIVHRLVKQGLVFQEKIAGHFEYKVELAEVSNKLNSLHQKLSPSQYAQNFAEKNVKQAHRGSSETGWSIPSVFEFHRSERVRILIGQGAEGDKRATRRLCGYVGYAVRCESKLEVLVSRHIANLLHSGAVAIPSIPSADLVRLNVVPNSYSTTHADMLVFRDSAMVIDLLKGAIEDISSPNAVEALKHLLDIACETGWSVDLSAWRGEV